VVFDISLNGLKFMGETLPPQGEQLALLVRLPHQQSPLKVDVATVRWRASQTIGLEFTTLSESAAMRLSTFIDHTLTDRTEPMSDVAQIDDSGKGTAFFGFRYPDPARPDYSVESLERMATIPERIQPEQSIERAQGNVLVLAEKMSEPVLMEAAMQRSVVTVQEPIYRYRVSPLVRWGIFLIAIFALYQAWREPPDRPTPQLQAQPANISAVSTPPIPSQIPRGEDAIADVPQIRLVDPDQPPNTSVNPIRAELEKERDVQAEADSQKLSEKALAKTDPNPPSSSQLQPAKIHLPALQSEAPRAPARGILAKESKKQAVAADLSRLSTGEKMVASPSATIHPSRRVTPVSVASSVKATSIPAVEPSPQPRTPNPSHFTVRFDGTEDRATWMRMQAILEYACQEIGQKFGYIPDRPIEVVLHMNQKFAEETGTPAWADTLFDQASGTIHIPAGQALDDLAWFSRVVRHEFVHALLHARMNRQLTATPTWLVEGLAIQLAEDPWSDLDEMRKKHPPFIPLASLQGRWKGIPADSLPMAYVEADLATRSLTERYGIHGVREVLTVVKAGQSLDAAMEAKLSLSYDKFQQQWAKDLKVHLQPDRS
jgi:hypothetical protein